MKKHLTFLLLLTFIFVGSDLLAQHSISVGMTPFGKLGIRSKGDKTDILTHRYSMSTPIYQISFETRVSGAMDLLLEGCYSKVDMRDETGSFDLNTDCYGFYAFQGINFLPGARVQLPIYIGVGACYYKELEKAGVYLDFAARARLKIYLLNRLAIYGGVFYNIGEGVNKTSERRYGVDSGILFNF